MKSQAITQRRAPTVAKNNNTPETRTANGKAKKIILSSVICILVIAAILTGLYFASYRKATVMKLGSYRITEDVYRYWYSEYKYAFMTSVNGVTDTEEFWNSKNADGITQEKFFSEIINTNIKRKLVASMLFDRFGYKMTDTAISEIEQTLSEKLEYLADGDKKKFNEYASRFGIDYKGYKNALLFDYKVLYLYNLLYGYDASGVNSEEIADYYNNNYTRVKVVIIRKYNDYRRDSENKPVTVNGRYVLVDYTEEKKQSVQDLISRMKDETDSGRITEEMFESYYRNENRDFNAPKYPDGFYFSIDAVYDKEMIDASFDMTAGEVRYFDRDDYTAFIMKYDLIENAFENDAYKNSEWFSTIKERAAKAAYNKLLDSYSEDIAVNKKIAGKIKLSEVEYSPDL